MGGQVDSYPRSARTKNSPVILCANCLCTSTHRPAISHRAREHSAGQPWKTLPLPSVSLSFVFCSLIGPLSRELDPFLCQHPSILDSVYFFYFVYGPEGLCSADSCASSIQRKCSPSYRLQFPAIIIGLSVSLFMISSCFSPSLQGQVLLVDGPFSGINRSQFEQRFLIRN